MAAEDTKKVSYKYKDNVFTDESIIKYFKQENFLYKYEYNLLGEFDDSGNYAIGEDLLKILVALNKRLIKKEGNKFFLTAKTSINSFNFIMEIGAFATSKLYANLQIVENPGADFENLKPIITQVAYYSDSADAYFTKKIYELFHIYEGDDTDGKDMANDMLGALLIEKIKLMKKLNERFISEMRQRDKMYVEKVLKMLALEKNGAILLKRYEELIRNVKILPTDKKYFKGLKQILDYVLIKNQELLSAEFNHTLQNMRTSYVEFNAEVINVAMSKDKVKAKDESVKLKSGPGNPNFKYTSTPSKNNKASSKYVSGYDIPGLSADKGSSEPSKSSFLWYAFNETKFNEKNQEETQKKIPEIKQQEL